MSIHPPAVSALPEGLREHVDLVVFDLAGTTIDFGCKAPISAFVGLFAERGVRVTEAQARRPMGLAKRAHIDAMLSDPEVIAAWAASLGAPPPAGGAAREALVDALYARATPLQIAVLPQHAAPIPGAVAQLDALRAAGVGVALTTGYNREMLDVLLPVAEAAGLRADLALASTDVRRGRPWPDLCWEAAMRLGGLRAARRGVNVGDTPVDMQTGRSAGFWTVGFALSGNELGLSAAELAALGALDRWEAGRAAGGRLRAAGAHEVVDDIGALGLALERVCARAAAGERP
ncbi:MAG: phosphonoacetaldehyde hydrolase [Deltaproteobacteria bacterium]|nr:phosphonoacetaldehyde hydrolase [Deltaproteobacteria bacterium]